MGRRHLLLCVCSAVLGAVGYRAYQHLDTVGNLEAQERPLPADRTNRTARAPNGQPDAIFRPQWNQPDSAAAPVADLTPEELVNIHVYEQTNRGVVNITTQVFHPNYFMMVEIPSRGTGSGSVLDRQGHILTNRHVIDGAEDIRVTLFDGESYEARIVGQDPQNDTAVLQIDAPAETLFPIPLGESTRLRVGQKVFAIGNPFGLERTMTVGIISSLERSLSSPTGHTMKSIIQIDAALNSGNSGGPLLDSHGHLIGMNTAIASSTGENTGVGFAIPVSTLSRVVPELVEYGKVIRADIGLSRFHETERGIVIVTLTPGGPAERAGLRGFRMVREQYQRGPFFYERRRVDRNYADTIVAVDEVPVRTRDELLAAIEKEKPGKLVRLTILREGRQMLVAVRLGEAQ